MGLLGFFLAIGWLIGSVPFLSVVMPRRHRTAVVVAAMWVAACAYAVWTEQPPPPRKSGDDFELDVSAKELSTLVLAFTAAGLGARGVARLLQWDKAPVFYFLVFFAWPVLLIPVEFYKGWLKRPATATCASQAHHAEIGPVRVRVKAYPSLALDLGKDERDWLFLWSGVHVRKLCSQTNDGRVPVQARQLWIYNSKVPGTERSCAAMGETYDIPRELCRTLLGEQNADFERAGRLPYSMLIIDAKQAQPKGDSHPVTYDSSTRATGDRKDRYLVSPTWRTADGSPWAAECSASGRESRDCRSTFIWKAGVKLSVSYYATASTIEADGRSAVDAVERLLEIWR